MKSCHACVKVIAHTPPILLASGRLLAPFRIFSVSIHAQSDLAASPTRPSRSLRCLRRVFLRIGVELYPQSSSIDNATTCRAAIAPNHRTNSSRPSSTSAELRRTRRHHSRLRFFEHHRSSSGRDSHLTQFANQPDHVQRREWRRHLPHFSNPARSL